MYNRNKLLWPEFFIMLSWYMYRPSKEPYNLGESPSLTGQFGMVSGKMFVLFVQCGGGFTGQWTTEQVQLNNFSGTNY